MYTVKINGLKMALGVVEDLVKASQWFTFEPLPDDDYEIAVKAENKALLDGIVAEVTFRD